MTLLAAQRLVLVAVGVAVALWLVDRALLWLEARGRIYYRRKKASSGTLSAAFLSVQAALEPGARHAAEERRASRPEAEEEGDPPEPDDEVRRSEPRLRLR